MLDDNWDLINGPVAHEIEVLNYSSQVNFIEALVKFVTFHINQKTAPEHSHPTEMVLRELHRTGTLLLLQEPGEYRSGEVAVTKGNLVIHQPPQVNEVRDLMTQFVGELAEMWATSTPIEIASFCLWRINWIHPFKNGNGRTARAFAYACLCLKFGFFLPGTRTVIDLIMENRPDYYQALKQADEVYNISNTYDVSQLVIFLERLLSLQLSSIETST